jgi:pseudouridine-5'-phosphate glycosidase
MDLQPSAEVQEALSAGRPLVALETSVVAHGLPPPHGLEAWQRCERAVRAAGAVPATIGLLDGQIRVGMSAAEVEQLASPSAHALKVGSGEWALAAAQGRSGGTTVSATCELAARAGIRVMATGGIGGVHRGDGSDVSQDLWALSRFPVAVVCAGVKAVLDLPRTLEALEALAVPVVGVGTQELPAFYFASSGLRLGYRVESPEQAAQLARARIAQDTGAIVFALPPPAGVALDRDEVERHLTSALEAARTQGVNGKAVTPFLLDALASATGGRALRANLALLESNAGFAAALAVQLK